jgi:hypothetical protein
VFRVLERLGRLLQIVGGWAAVAATACLV